MCDSCPTLLDKLIHRGILLDTGVDGLYGRSGLFEQVIDGFDRIITKLGVDQSAEVMRFPPGMNRALFEKTGYLKNFPQLAGFVHSFDGDDKAHAALLGHLENGEDWTDNQEMTDVALTPAACYPVYPIVAQRGKLAPGGAVVDVQSYCFRHEPSREPTRMQMFRMREYVRIGAPDDALAFRQTWLERGRDFIGKLQLPFEIDLANDPFFGRAGRVMASSQRDQELKFELLVPVNDGAGPTACMSFNYHQDHFGSLWGIRTAADETAHTACVGFGMERIAVALFRHHGLDVAGWPAGVRDALGF
jgi:seryl-tRNA synthetase